MEVDESVLWMATLGFLLKLVRVLRLSTPGVLFLEKVKGAEPGPVFRLATLGFFLEKQVRVFFWVGIGADLVEAPIFRLLQLAGICQDLFLRTLR